ncbi:MAG: hypothetical protein K0U24_05900 [Gammaproteobacteria bacterium]|nr:hypothetical protein [Gammaproteobacteria bacterium]MCH9763738.1 hypothetical protein [Gammaproteobacteria bacterium]
MDNRFMASYQGMGIIQLLKSSLNQVLSKWLSDEEELQERIMLLSTFLNDESYEITSYPRYMQEVVLNPENVLPGIEALEKEIIKGAIQEAVRTALEQHSDSEKFRLG